MAPQAETVRTAACACGQLKAHCRGEPDKVSLCHCLDCQRRTGSAFGVAVFYPRAAVETAGRAASYRRPSDSGFAITFHFCSDCGSTVYWAPERKPEALAVALGAFADPAFPAPGQAVWEERRHPWVTLDLPAAGKAR